MFVIIWKYRVKPGRERDFVRVYGREGAWVRFFRKSSGYLGTELREPDSPGGEFETTDRWISRAAFESFKRENRVEYNKIDKHCESLSTDEVKVGEFEIGS